MRNNIIFIIAFYFSMSPAFAQHLSDVLENAIRGVVTIGVYNKGELSNPLMGQGLNGIEDVAYSASIDFTDATGLGSGFIYEYMNKHYIVTNAHVVENAGSEPGDIKIISIDGEKYNARLFGGDSFYDIALLTFEKSPENNLLKPLKMAEKSPRLGESVFSIGNPLSYYPYSVTDGIIGGKNRLYTNETKETIKGRFGYLQHSATISWGNSGGPLVNSKGEVVGMNSWIEISRNNVIPQLNFALDVEILNKIIPEMINNGGRLNRVYLGVEFSTVRRFSGISDPVIRSVIPDGTDRSKLEKFIEIPIKTMNKHKIKSLQDILMLMEGLRKGDKVTFKFNNGKSISLKLGEMKTNNMHKHASAFLDQYSQYSIKEIEGTVYLNARKEAPLISLVEKEQEGKQGVGFSEIRGESEYKIIGAGDLGWKGNSGKFYKIRNLHDFACVIRLASMNGYIDVLPESSVKRVIRITMEDELANPIKSLFY